MAGRKIARRTFPSGAPIWTDTNTRGGWLLGGGIEYGFKPNWTVKLEYNYLKLGDWTAPTIPAEWHRDVQMIKMGMNYKFESGNSDEAARTPDDSTGSARAKGRQAGTEDLAKASQNPIASLTTLPFQNNSNFNNGPFGRTQNVLNIEPVVPMSLNAQWNVISRTIIPCTLEPPAESGCYVYEVGCDAGSGDRVGCFQSRVVGVGPQVGFIIPVSATTQAYLNFKATGSSTMQPTGWLECLGNARALAGGEVDVEGGARYERGPNQIARQAFRSLLGRQRRLAPCSHQV